MALSAGGSSPSCAIGCTIVFAGKHHGARLGCCAARSAVEESFDNGPDR